MSFRQSRWLFTTWIVGLLVLGCSGGNGDATPTDGSSGGSPVAPFGTGGTAVTSGGNGAAAGASYVEPVENLDLDATPAPLVTLNLEVASSDMASLDADPFNAPDVPGAFTDAVSVRYAPIDVNYRGAYALQTLIRSGALQRNWKLKFAKELPYQNRREWNFTYETHVRQRLAYWLMRLADVKVPSARHVVLRVNGQTHGLYLEYEDPDDKTFLLDKFGDNEGDLYKAGYDIPGETPYFATLEVLGQTDADYAMHYRKKTNNDDPVKATDYSALRSFIAGLNETPDADFEAYLRSTFDVDRFIGYLVVANFMSHWDSLPQRPKNFWLYQVPATGKWAYIPWDMDATFQSTKFSLNPMGTDVSVFYQFDKFVEYKGRQAAEGTARPLVTRMMKVPAFRSAYVARYRAALKGFLAQDYLMTMVAKFSAIAAAAAQPDELPLLEEERADVEEFIGLRVASVSAELANQP
jgi:spore coat protein H